MSISNTDNIIDSRDVITSIEEIVSELEDTMDASDDTEDLEEELTTLKALAEEGESATSEWSSGVTLISEDHFEDYAQQLAEDIGAVGDCVWPTNHIDWKGAAGDLSQDYTTVSFDGNSYYVRS